LAGVVFAGDFFTDLAAGLATFAATDLGAEVIFFEVALLAAVDFLAVVRGGIAVTPQEVLFPRSMAQKCIFSKCFSQKRRAQWVAGDGEIDPLWRCSIRQTRR